MLFCVRTLKTSYIAVLIYLEQEYDNDAELSIGNLSWNNEDDDLDIGCYSVNHVIESCCTF